MGDWTTIDFFNDKSLIDDPYAYYDELREQCPVLPLPHLGIVAVSGPVPESGTNDTSMCRSGAAAAAVTAPAPMAAASRARPSTAVRGSTEPRSALSHK